MVSACRHHTARCPHSASYLRDIRLAAVTSNFDPEGEWLAISEVAGETDSSPSPTSGVFRGQVLLSADASASAKGDDAVWVRGGDEVVAAYYEPGGIDVISTYRAQVVFQTSTPQALPAESQWSLLSLTVVFALASAWQAHRRSGASERG